MNVLIFKFMIVCIDCFKLFQTISNKNKACNGPGSQSESENRTRHHAQTSRKKKVFYRLFERMIVFPDILKFKQQRENCLDLPVRPCTGNQCSEIRVGANFLFLVTILSTIFWKRCMWFSKLSGIP